MPLAKAGPPPPCTASFMCLHQTEQHAWPPCTVVAAAAADLLASTAPGWTQETPAGPLAWTGLAKFATRGMQSYMEDEELTRYPRDEDRAKYLLEAVKDVLEQQPSEEPQAKLEHLLAVFTGEFDGLIETLRADLENESH